MTGPMSDIKPIDDLVIDPTGRLWQVGEPDGDMRAMTRLDMSRESAERKHGPFEPVVLLPGDDQITEEHAEWLAVHYLGIAAVLRDAREGRQSAGQA